MEELLALIASPFVLAGCLLSFAIDPSRPIWVRLVTVLTALAVGALVIGAIGVMFFAESAWGRYAFGCGIAGIFLGLFSALIGTALSGTQVRF